MSATPLTLLKLCVCFLHDMRMCIWFAYNCCINFCQFSPFIYRLCEHVTYNTITILCPLLKLMLHLCPHPPPHSQQNSYFFCIGNISLFGMYFLRICDSLQMFLCNKWEYPCAFNEIPTFISSTWNNHYLFVGMGVEWGAGATPLSAEFWFDSFVAEKTAIFLLRIYFFSFVYFLCVGIPF